VVKKFSVLLLFLVVTSASAATISVKVDRDPVAMNETFRIIFTAEGSLDDEPDFSPLNQDFELLGTGQSSQFSMINGKVSSSKTYTLNVAPLRQGKLTIPSISFGRDRSQPTDITVTAASKKSSRPTPPAPAASPDLMFMTLETDSLQPYVQQQVILKLRVYRHKQWAEANLSDPVLEGVEASIQQLGKEVAYDSTVNGKNYQVTELRYLVFPQQSGTLVIDPFRVTARFPAGVKKQQSPFRGFSSDPFFDDFFSRRTYVTQSASSKPLTLTIKPIPAAFTGKLWLPAKDIQLQQTWSGDISRLETGEPVTRTIAIIGDGVASSQLPEITSPESDELKVYPDQPVVNEQITEAGLLTTHTLKFAMIPTRPGRHKVPAIEVPWWDINTDSMRIAKLDATSLQATGTIQAPQPNQATGVPPAAMPTVTTDDSEAAADKTEPPPGESMMVQLLLAAVIALALLWMATMFYLIKTRNRASAVTEPEPESEHKPDRKRSLKELADACRQDNPGMVRDALIEWAKNQWPGDPPNSLEDIAGRMPGESGAPVMQLSASLYSPDAARWDGSAIYEAVSKLTTDKSSSNPAKDDVLQPLYR
jgi:hypothetical protein